MPLITDFNQKFHSEYSELIKDLNKWVSTPRIIGAKWTVPDIQSEVFTPTIAPPGADAFNLNPPIAGNVRSFEFDTNTHTTYPRVIVGRMVIGLAHAQRWVEGTGSDLKPYIYDALRQVIQMKEITPNTLTFGHSLITFSRPGQPEVYGRELENAAAIEIRYFSDCITLDKMKEIMNENNQNPQIASRS